MGKANECYCPTCGQHTIYMMSIQEGLYFMQMFGCAHLAMTAEQRAINERLLTTAIAASGVYLSTVYGLCIVTGLYYGVKDPIEGDVAALNVHGCRDSDGEPLEWSTRLNEDFTKTYKRIPDEDIVKELGKLALMGVTWRENERVVKRLYTQREDMRRRLAGLSHWPLVDTTPTGVVTG